MKIKIKKLNDNAVIPSYAHKTDAGLDLTAVSYGVDINTDTYIYHTGIAIEIPEGHVGLIFPRSSNRRTEAYMTNHVGVIDSGYRGEVLVCFKNRTNKDLSYTINDITTDLYAHIDDTTDQRNDEYVNEIVEENKHITAAPYKVGERIAQLIIIPYPHIEFEEVDELSDSDRGEGGHGSTGE